MNQSSAELRHIILQQLSAIPKGRVITYGDLARMAGYPNHARFVGSVLKHLPKDTELPWHRVINGQGKISFPEGSDAFKEQKKRLEKDGIALLNGKVNLKLYRL
jgi:methylated-DNA-protein-cysteine methyltransferase-like protein